MTPNSTIERISEAELKEMLGGFAKRHFQTDLNGLLEIYSKNQLDPCDDAEIMSLISMLKAYEAGQRA